MPFGSPRTTGTYILEIVQPFGRDPARRAIRVRCQGERSAVAPSPAHLCGQQLGIDPVLVRLQEVLKADDIGPDLPENGKTEVQI